MQRVRLKRLLQLPDTMPAADTYFITWKGRRDGPYSLEQLTELLNRGEIGLLHRVETVNGLVPLRDLLPETTTPTDFTPVKTEYGLLGPPTTLAHAAMSSSAPSSANPPVPETPTASTPASESIAPEKAARLYTICGLCFVFPPLVAWSWMLAGQLAKQGQPVTAARTKWLSAGLASGGILLWVLLWCLW
jgi:hypothetical protein